MKWLFMLCFNVFGSAINANADPPWLINNPLIPKGKGTLSSATDIGPFNSLTSVGKTHPKLRGWDDEAYDAINLFFWGQENGIVLEMGALDGKLFSVSSDFIPFGWHRVLIEATPKFVKVAKEVSPDATFIGAPVCDMDSVHYLIRPLSDNAINGIAEFMDESFIKQMHPHVYAAAMAGGKYDLNQVDWGQFSHFLEKNDRKQSIVQVRQCVRIHDVLSQVAVAKVNFFVLDVEGGELNVLNTIDFSKVNFDVICVETYNKLRPEGFKDRVVSVLAQNDYVFEFDKGRNSWFRHKDFVAKTRISQGVHLR